MKLFRTGSGFFSWSLLFFSSFCAVFLSLQLFFPLSLLGGSEHWQQSSPFHALAEYHIDLVTALGQCREQLEQSEKELSYVERQQLQTRMEQLSERLSIDSTNFRYQVKTADGAQILLSCVEDDHLLEQDVAQVFYRSFVRDEQGGFSDAEAEQAPQYILEWGVPEHPMRQDGFLFLHRIAQQTGSFPAHTAGIVLCLVAFFLSLVWILASCGHWGKGDGIVLSGQDRLFFDLYLILSVSVGGMLVLAAGALGLELRNYYYTYFFGYPAHGQWLNTDVTMLMQFGVCIVCSLLCITATLLLRTLAVRLKARALRKTTLVCRVVGWMFRNIRDFFRALPVTWKIVLLFAIYFSTTLNFCLYGRSFGFLAIIWLALSVILLAYLCWWTVSFHHLRQGSRAIAQGDLAHQIDTTRMPHDLKAHGEELNNISAGLSSAVDEKMRSERFKAELITNVSHDLKTPLTSIINYVSLLKGTEQTDPKAVEYIAVLDRKSQRLKKLTEDLVEASKASTGVLRAERERLSMTQLLDQALGEWEERLQQRQLALVKTVPEGECWVCADGHHLWRIIDNLLSNCSKYAMAGTRIYLDLARGHGQITLSVKNISREPLNVSPERLMERFVRGDESRTTDGSGLGLSIARSLTELQGGTFQLSVDGDLFKASLSLPQAN